MKKLMFAIAAAACGTVFAAAVESANVVGYMEKTIDQDLRPMRAATFLPVSGSGATMTIGDFKMPSDTFPGLFTLGVYGDNVNCLNEYWYFDATTIAEAELEIDVGWYELMVDPDEGIIPNFEKGPQDATSLPFGSACVMTSGLDGATYSTAGEVSSVKYEMVVDQDARRMAGNALPKNIRADDLIIGTEECPTYPGLFTLGIYGNNVDCQNEYWFFDANTIAEAELGIEEGWYVLIVDPDEGIVPDFERGKQIVEIEAGQGFVMTSGLDGAVFALPSAL